MSKQPSRKKPPPKSQQSVSNPNSNSLLAEKLKDLKVKLKKSFSNEFIESVCYFLEFEQRREDDFRMCLAKIEWLKLNYFLQQLKKICKQRHHLFMFVHITANSYETDLKTSCTENVADCLNDRVEENFSLVRVMVNLLVKMFNLDKSSEKNRMKVGYDEVELFKLELTVLSCLADLCYYEEIKIQVVNDSNINRLFELFVQLTNLEMDFGGKKKVTQEDKQLFSTLFRNVKKYWSKMCRLAANLCQGTHSIKIKNLITKDFVMGICRCMDKQIKIIQVQENLNNCENNANDLDLYHSVIRFIRYSSNVVDCKRSILESRILVNICRAIFVYNKNLTFILDEQNDTPGSEMPQKDEKVDISLELPIKILVNKKSHFLCKELIKHYLIMLDNWSKPICTEFYNQIIEGNSIEHLLWLHIDDPVELKSITSIITNSKNSPTITTTSKTSTLTFSYSEFAFNLLLKLCHDYHVCRAEFGRSGGLTKYLNQIESLHEKQIEYETLVEMICLSCKESVNRLRLKEQQGHLLALVKYQQALKADRKKVSEILCSDSCVHNKLLVALCCFAHDQESINILLGSGLVDSLLGFLSDSVLQEKNKRNTLINRSNQNNNKDYSILLRSQSFDERLSVISLSDILQVNSKETTFGKKRKASEPTMPGLETKRSKSIGHSNLSGSFPASSMETNITDAEQQAGLSSSSSFQPLQNQQMTSTSPDSYCSLSPSSTYPFSPVFSPSSPTVYRPNSAVMFATSSNSLYSTSSFSPFSPSFNGMYSPQFVASDDPLQHSTIQFSPTIDRYDEEDEQEEEETPHIMPIKLMTSQPKDGNYSILSQPEEELEIEAEEDKKAACVQSESVKFTLNNSNCSNSDIDDVTRLESLLGTPKHENKHFSQSIESIHRTEACVLYVLSQLSHGDKPSPHLFSNFDAVITCLLEYMKYAPVRNPRALRILNRLTKNTYCFMSFVLAGFPYRIKAVFYEGSNYKKNISNRTVKKISFSRSCTDLDKLKTKGRGGSFSQVTSGDEDVEKEMNVYLNSNKVFFDAHTFFPSFESIEFTLVNNLKMQCMSSSDHGYVCLVAMMKSGVAKQRLACALVAPFILRNSKALQNILVHLNGIDPVIDQIFPSNSSSNSVQPDTDIPLSFKQNALVCIRKILTFVNYKYEKKLWHDKLEGVKLKFNNSTTKTVPNDKKNIFKFIFYDSNNFSKTIEVNSEFLAGKSEYFNALFCGSFLEGTCKELCIKDISYEIFSIIIDLIHSSNASTLTHELTFTKCIDLILAADKLILTDLKDLFVHIILGKFLNLSTCFVCFRLGWLLSSQIIEKACIDLFLSKFLLKETSDEEEEDVMDDTGVSEISRCSLLIEYAIESLKQSHLKLGEDELTTNLDENLNDHFKKRLKATLSEIIKK